MISGIIIILFIAMFLFIGIRRGAAVTLLNLIALAAAAFVACLLAGVIAQAIYNGSIKPTVTKNIQSFITQGGNQYAAENSLKALPDSIQSILGFFLGMFGLSLQDAQGRLTLSGAQTTEIVNTIEKPVGELAVFAIAILLTVVLFIVLLIIFKLIARLIGKVFNLPVIRHVDMALGGILGFVEGVVLVIFLANLCYVYLKGTNPAALNNGTVFGSMFRALLFK